MDSGTEVGTKMLDIRSTAFLHKLSHNKLKAVFKVGTDAVSLIASIREFKGVKYIDLDVFLPNPENFKKLNLDTFGLLGSYDGESNKDCIRRDGLPHDCTHNGFSTC